MRTLTREELFAMFQPSLHTKLSGVLARPSISGLAVYESQEGKRRATPVTHRPPPAELEDGYQLLGLYRKPELESSTSRTMAALEYLAAHADMTPYAVAKLYGVSPTAVYSARKRRIAKVICPCCGQIVREGFVVNDPGES